MNRNHKPERWLKSALGTLILGASMLGASRASAEVTIVKGATWDVYVSGRVGTFFSYARGQGYPVPKVPGSQIQPGGGVDTDDPRLDTYDDTNGVDAMGVPIPQQGKLNKLRVRSGYYPNILTLGAHKTFGAQLRLTVQASLWGTVEPTFAKGSLPPNPNRPNGGRENGVEADFREAFMRIEGGWGEVNAGKFVSTFGRGLTEIDVLYGHGYGVGFPTVYRSQSLNVTGDLRYQGPTGGMTGFGVLSATYSAGATYTTPSLAGVHFTLGVYDPVTYTYAGWSRTRTPRPEAELRYDYERQGLAVHLFGSGGFQALPSPNEDTVTWGAMAGGRLEIGPVRVGVGGFTGRAPGINYAFDDNTALSSSTSQRAITVTASDGTTSQAMENSYELRNTRGFIGMLQLRFGPVDISGGFGQTRIAQVAADEAAAQMVSTLKTQTGVTGALVYHLNESFHIDVDAIRGSYHWYNGEAEALNLLNAGVTVTF